MYINAHFAPIFFSAIFFAYFLCVYFLYFLTFTTLGVPIAEHKTEGPSIIIEFLGIILDSQKMEARLPPDKLNRLSIELDAWHIKKSATLQELQSLIGTLYFACKVIPLGRAFLQRIINLTRGVPTDHAGPLFCYSNGTPSSRSQFTKELRALLAQGAGINIADYAGHSFRIGAATTAASKGLPHWLIQTLGRWSSDCHLRHIRTPAYVLADVSKRLIAT